MTPSLKTPDWGKCVLSHPDLVNLVHWWREEAELLLSKKDTVEPRTMDGGLDIIRGNLRRLEFPAGISGDISRMRQIVALLEGN